MLTEPELIARLAHYFKECEETCRALAQLRKDERWVKMSAVLTATRERCAELARRRAA